MNVEADRPALFVSYAWGGSLEKKEWLRNEAIGVLGCVYSTFWDRDSVHYGQLIDDVISEALATRPVTVLCFCDSDYCMAAATMGSGVWRELAIIEKISRDPGVRVVPLLLDERCINMLPAQLLGRAYLDLTKLVSRGIHLANVLMCVVEGATQAEIYRQVAEALRITQLRQEAMQYFCRCTFEIYGNARTHQVSFTGGTPLLPPQWMRTSKDWSYAIFDDHEDFSPLKGVWHWDHWTPSRAMQALGTAVCAAYFPERTSPQEIAAIEACGSILAVKEFSMIKRTEQFVFNSRRLTQILLSSGEGIEVLTTLLAKSTRTA